MKNTQLLPGKQESSTCRFLLVNTQGARELQIVLTGMGCDTETAFKVSKEICVVVTLSDNWKNQNLVRR